MIEDDPDITTLLVNFLRRHEMEVDAYDTPSAGMAALERDRYNLIILDLSLPELDGLEVCRNIRAIRDTPIIVSSARSDIDDKLVALEYGADDYLPKPYEPIELIARIKSVMRRYRPAQEALQREFELFEADEIIRFRGETLELTPAEYGVLRLMILEPQKVLGRDFLANNAEAIGWNSSPRTVDVVVSRLRQKIEADPKEPVYIKSVRGRGYLFNG